MSRLLPIPEHSSDPIVRPIFDALMSRGAEVGLTTMPQLYRVLANSPVLLKAWTDLAWPLRQQASTSRALRELIAMRVAQLTRTSYLWRHHWAAAIPHGVRVEQLTSLGAWERSEHFNSEEIACLRFTDEMIRDFSVRDSTYEALAALFPPHQIVELTLTVAWYACSAHVLRALEIETNPEFEVHPDLPAE